MSEIARWFVWLLPLFIVPASYLSYRILPGPRLRYWVAALLFLGAFILNLLHISFTFDPIDTIAILMMWFFVVEWTWYLSRLKKKKWFFVGMSLVTAALVYSYRNWILSGPHGMDPFKTPDTCNAPPGTSPDYFIEDRLVASNLGTTRTISIRKQLPGQILEKELDLWTAPLPYAKTPFSYRWGVSALGPKVDMVDGATVIWSLGEGL